MPSEVDTKALGRDDLALGIQRRQGDVIIRADLKTEQRRLILDGFHRGRRIRRGSVDETGKLRFGPFSRSSFHLASFFQTSSTNT